MKRYYFTTEAANLINPPLHTKFFEKYKDSLENIYSSRRKAPLGCMPVSNIPHHNNSEMVFGVSTARGIPAIDLMFPSGYNNFQSIYSNDFSYKICSDSAKPAGFKIEKLENSDEQMKKLINHNRKEHSTIILPSSYTKKVCCNYRENYIDDSIKRKDYTNVIDEKRNDIKENKSKKDFMDNHLVEIVWNLLKIKNHENFQDLVSAFKAYKNENDKITLLDLQKMCQRFGISTSIHTLEQLLEKCNIIDKDGALSFEEFMHSLNWKDMVPENCNIKNEKYANDWKERMINSSNLATDNYQTTASLIGNHKQTVSMRTAGLPSQRDKYANASSMIQPNAFSKYGIYEQDLCKLLSKEEIKSLLTNSGIKLNESVFEVVWQNVQNNNQANIGKVWSALRKNCFLSNPYQ